MKIGTEVAGKSIVGNRDTQQDFFRLILSDELGSDDETLLVLADGMGGQVGGGEASRIAVDTFAYTYRHAGNGGRVRDRLRHALHAANSGIREATAANEKLRGMGSTLAAVLIRPQRVIWASVGDSPVWLWHRHQLRRLNADHSLRSELDELVEAGRITSAEAVRHPHRHALRSALCGEPLQLIDINLTELAEGDIVLVGSDGVQTLSDVQIERILDRHQDKSAAELVELCLREVELAHDARQDNATLVVCKYRRRPLARLMWGMPAGLGYGLVAGVLVIAAASGGYTLLGRSPEPAPPPATAEGQDQGGDATTGAQNDAATEGTAPEGQDEWEPVGSGEAPGESVATPAEREGPDGRAGDGQDAPADTTPPPDELRPTDEEATAAEDAPAGEADDHAPPPDEARGDGSDQDVLASPPEAAAGETATEPKVDAGDSANPPSPALKPGDTARSANPRPDEKSASKKGARPASSTKSGPTESGRNAPDSP